MRKGDKEDIKHEEEICISLNEYKLDDQTLKSIFKKKIGEEGDFPHPDKVKGKSSTTNNYTVTTPSALFRKPPFNTCPPSPQNGSEAWDGGFGNQSNTEFSPLLGED